MRAGELRHKITIHTTADEAGPDISTVDVFAALEHIGPTERRFTIRYTEINRRAFQQVLDGTTEKIHLTFGSRIFDITDMDEDRKHLGELIVLAEERVQSS